MKTDVSGCSPRVSARQIIIAIHKFMDRLAKTDKTNFPKQTPIKHILKVFREFHTA